MSVKLLTEHHFEFLSLKGGCTDSSESTQIKIPHNWKSHVAAQQLLSVTSRINCIVARCLINVVYLTACCLYQVMMTLHSLNDVANDAESTYKSKMKSYRYFEE